MAPIFATANIATDHNQLTMEIMKKVADRHGLVCLLHEKPFAGINGSGKHNNWSITTNTGINLLDPTDEPNRNTMFLLFLCAVIKAVDEHQDLLRISVASAANDHRLGANEAPPAIVSMYLGDELMAVLDAIENNKSYEKTDSGLLRYAPRVAPFGKRHYRPQPNLPLCIYGKQIRVPNAGFRPVSIRTQHSAQYHCRRGAGCVCRRTGGSGRSGWGRFTACCKKR